MEYKITSKQIAEILDVTEEELFMAIGFIKGKRLESISREKLIQLIRAECAKYLSVKAERVVSSMDDFLFPIDKENIWKFEKEIVRYRDSGKVLRDFVVNIIKQKLGIC